MGGDSGSVEGARAMVFEHSKVFTYLFVMLGPIKLLAPFVRITNGMDTGASRRLALQGFGIACLAGVVAAFVGEKILVKWGISLPALLLAAGLVLLVIAMQSVLAQYDSSRTPGANQAPPPAAARGLAFSPLAFPSIVTPYGTAALILLVGASGEAQDLFILGMFLGIMLLNLVAMWFARPILKFGAGALQVLGAVLGVLQVALAIQMILVAARVLGVLPQS